MDTYVEDMMLQVDRLFDDGEYAEGRKVLEEILEMEPDCGRAHNHIGWLHYYKLDNYRKAEYHYKLALKFSPKYPNIWINYANFLGYLGRTAELQQHCERALQIPGVNKAAIYNQLGQAAETDGNFDEALKNYETAYMRATNKADHKTFLENFNRVKSKLSFWNKLRIFFTPKQEKVAKKESAK